MILTIVVATRKEYPAENPHQKHRTSSSEIPLSTQPVSEWAKLKLSPNGMSERIPSVSGMRLDANGDDFHLRTIYADGKEDCVRWANDGKAACPNGSVAGYIIENTRKGDNTVSYAYAPL